MVFYLDIFFWFWRVRDKMVTVELDILGRVVFAF